MADPLGVRLNGTRPTYGEPSRYQGPARGLHQLPRLGLPWTSVGPIGGLKVSDVAGQPRGITAYCLRLDQISQEVLQDTRRSRRNSTS